MASRTGQGGRRGAPTHRSQPVRCGIGQPCAPTALTRNRRVSAVVRAPWDSCVIRPASAAALAQTSVSSGPGRALGPSCGRETQRERERDTASERARESARERPRERVLRKRQRKRKREGWKERVQDRLQNSAQGGGGWTTCCGRRYDKPRPV